MIVLAQPNTLVMIRPTEASIGSLSTLASTLKVLARIEGFPAKNANIPYLGPLATSADPGQRGRAIAKCARQRSDAALFVMLRIGRGLTGHFCLIFSCLRLPFAPARKSHALVDFRPPEGAGEGAERT